jgi:hypothetical protein
LMTAALRLLTWAMHYDVPPQNLHTDLSLMPALPSRFTIRHVKAVHNSPMPEDPLTWV